MTISYSGNFLQLLLRWKGSIFRSVWKELLIYLGLHYLIRFVYTDILPWADPDGKLKYRDYFISICQQFNEYTKLIPLTFLLGFYVSNVVSRWWRQFECLCWPEDLLSLLCFVVPSSDPKQARVRHRIARYLNLTCALAWRDVSSKIRLRFPTVRHIVDSGLLTESEYEQLMEISRTNQGCVWLTPLHWVQQIVSEIVSETGALPAYVNNFNQELKTFRISFRRLFCHDWVCVPLVYTQVAALATYAFFFFCLFGRQSIVEIEAKGRSGFDAVDLRFPLFTVVQFLFFVGWFKVGQDLMRPFGLDDDDIELAYILDRNIVTSFTIVNILQNKEPPAFEEDAFWKVRDQPNAPDSKLRFGRIDLSRTAHKHPPKLHMLEELKGKDFESEIENGGCTLHENKETKGERKLLLW
ncbi:unnamed protein product, partial [Mesorhabditis belari]|uniref:Bestrophin homolog n=1 Tax=Mesorhabditis belari TaxID=2138241 RepID=A0AAF3JAI4_9BILA